ncbi:YhcN/YlaJ family sporulation lipoprotein [Bacillus sp. REN3]|uniref:YhcN/YlaJ family sporulation lipoprotein n=1 Tax=Bacillus sp. REN3 TaxID=2802440 RepID=UPI001AEE2949|nr:YhcN/YlaJ family sporulation lipoprotein [Bacillus sp. REN3]
MLKLFAAISFVLLISACSWQNDEAREEQDKRVKVQNSYIQQVDRQSGQEISEHLVNLTADIKGVDDATAVVIGRYAIVGIDVNQNMERSEVDTVKYTVAEALKKDPHGARAAVIADPDVTARLKEIGKDIRAGKPIQGILNELADITGRIIPEVPADMIDPQSENPTEDPKKRLDQQEKRTLEKNQEQESNFHK